MRGLCFALVGLAALAARSQDPSVASSGRPSGPPLAGSQLDARTEDVAALLRCPVCQGLSVADSPAAMARNMKMQVREKLAAGYDRDQILADFESSYGEFVRLEPPMRGVNWLVWAGPVAGLIAGGAMVARALKRPPQGGSAPEASPGETPASDLPAPETLPGDPELAAAVLRVRQLAYGWPGGVPPKVPSTS